MYTLFFFLAEKTQIFDAPEAKVAINVSNDVVLKCNATTDPEELSMLRIDWLKNGEKIDYDIEMSLSKNSLDNSLKITAAQVSDTATYTCRASNDLDSHDVNVQLVVKGKTFLSTS